ncbi:uncharacterized protein LOC129617035 [Condylostylus longicornis]|uniref:uncharacterized protein LOC129617035 n=1 Tax=Condylostylus longicornis TaxID=2530218 RepID=UPI00244DAD80|nr:uncharacterized protein LOC129617035 [Condylostylus longicornis]
MRLQRCINDGRLTIIVEFRPSVFNGSENSKVAGVAPATDFSVTIQPTGTPKGITIWCTTSSCFTESSRRFSIASVRYFESADEKLFGYNGPEFTDLSSVLRTHFDAWFLSIGLDEKLCDLIDDICARREHFEYQRWRQGIQKLTDR